MSARLFDQLQNFRGSAMADRRRPPPPLPDPETSKVKRALFGPGNTEENLKFVKRELEKNVQEQSAKYNFDFSAERPLQGRYEWEVMDRVPPLSQHQVRPLTATADASSTSRAAGDLSETVDSKIEAEKGRVCDDEEGRGGKVTPEAIAPIIKPPRDKESSGAGEPPPSPPPPRPESPSSSSSSRSESGAAATTRSAKPTPRQGSITDHFSHRKRSRSKVKTQERKTDEEGDALTPNPAQSRGEINDTSSSSCS